MLNISNLNPTQGTSLGTATINITGTNLSTVTTVNFGSTLSSSFNIISSTQISAVAPAGVNVVNVFVTTPTNISNSLPFIYIQPPFVNKLSSTSGPIAGGNNIKIHGYNLGTTNSVIFGTNAATIVTITDSTITVTVPQGIIAGYIVITITTIGGINSQLIYNYINEPTITTIIPTSGSIYGGTDVTIRGTNFTTTRELIINGTDVLFNVINDTTITFITPAGSGVADVSVQTVGGLATSIEKFTYINLPEIF